MEKKFIANKAVLMNPQGKVLFVRESGEGTSVKTDKWTLPGGRMDKGETPQENLEREIFEETGLKLDASGARPVHVDLWGERGDVENQPIVGVFYLVLVGDITVKLSSEHSEFIWVDLHKPLPEDIDERPLRAVQKIQSQEGLLMAANDSIKGRQGYGLIQVVTGNGKGKTTAALGQAIRAVGAGKRVGIVYFDKGGNDHYFERKVLEGLEGVDYVATGRDRIDPVSSRFDFSIQDTDRAEAERGLKEVSRMFDEGYDLVVMDEINSTTDLGMVSVESVLEVLKQKPETTELIMTGRNAPEAFVELAHLVTEMKLKKHYFYSGVKAREGLDY